VKLTARDSQLVTDIYVFRFLTIPQIRELHFPSMQTAYRRVRLLKSIGLLDSFEVANIPESIFRVTAKGLQMVAECLGVERDDLKWNEATTKPKDYYFMRHFLEINDFRITLRHACAAQHVKLVGFIPDYVGERTDKGGIVKYVRDVICDKTAERREVSHTPDGVFALERHGKTALFFLEIDRGTETISDKDKGVLKALHFYTQYLTNDGYQRYTKDFGVEEFKGFRSLFVTSSALRLTNIRQATTALKVPQKALQFQWIATSEQVTKEGVFGPIWKSVDPEDSSSYQIVR
jgi:hypothetical protein